MPHVAVNGIKLNYEDVGNGPPLLLISGLGANRTRYASVVPLLSSRYRVVTFDNRGTGLSDVPPGPYRIEDMAADTAGLIDHLEIGPVAAVGWSMGGVILQSLLIDYPDRFSAAVLLSTLPSYTDLQHPWLDALLTLRQVGTDPVALGAIGLPWSYTPYTLSNHVKVREMVELATKDPTPTSYEGYAAQAHAIRVFDRRSELGGVRTPTLVLVGAEDVLTPPSQSIEMAQRIPGAEFVILPRGGHAMLAEFPGPTLEAIEAFLSGAARPAG